MQMNGNLIDTNIIIKAMHNENVVVDCLLKLDSIYIPVITIGELAYGTKKSKRQKANQILLDEFVAGYEVLEVDEETAKAYGQIKADLVKQGKNIPENDLWIAAIAIRNNLALITCDGHFEGIPNLNSVIL